MNRYSQFFFLILLFALLRICFSLALFITVYITVVRVNKNYSVFSPGWSFDVAAYWLLVRWQTTEDSLDKAIDKQHIIVIVTYY